MIRQRLGSAALAATLGLAGCGQSGEEAAAPRSPATFELDRADVRRGQAVYEKHCLACHGKAGAGTVLAWRIRDADGHLPPPPLDGSARAALKTNDELLAIVRDGSPPGAGKMPAWKNRLPERDIVAVVTYIKSLWTPAVYRLWWNAERQAANR